MAWVHWSLNPQLVQFYIDQGCTWGHVWPIPLLDLPYPSVTHVSSPRNVLVISKSRTHQYLYYNFSKTDIWKMTNAQWHSNSHIIYISHSLKIIFIKAVSTSLYVINQIFSNHIYLSINFFIYIIFIPNYVKLRNRNEVRKKIVMKFRFFATAKMMIVNLLIKDWKIE